MQGRVGMNCVCTAAVASAIAANRAGIPMNEVAFLCLKCNKVFSTEKRFDESAV